MVVAVNDLKRLRVMDDEGGKVGGGSGIWKKQGGDVEREKKKARGHQTALVADTGSSIFLTYTPCCVKRFEREREEKKVCARDW